MNKSIKTQLKEVMAELQAEVDLINSYSGPRNDSYVMGLNTALAKLSAIKDPHEERNIPAKRPKANLKKKTMLRHEVQPIVPRKKPI